MTDEAAMQKLLSLLKTIRDTAVAPYSTLPHRKIAMNCIADLADEGMAILRAGGAP